LSSTLQPVFDSKNRHAKTAKNRQNQLALTAIVRASHSEALICRCEAFAPQIKLMNLSIEVSTTLEQLRLVSEEHKLIFQAFKRHWVDSAVSLLKNHIVDACRKHIETAKAKLRDRSKKA